MKTKRFYVYILASKSRTIYVGVTSDLLKRVYEHKNHLREGFTSRYKIDRLVYFEEYNDVREALDREKHLKNWRRDKKIFLIENTNPTWTDLSEAFYD